MGKSAEFQQFLKEIDDHFVHVVGDVLGWTVLEPPRFTEGNGNIVLRFRTAQGSFIFRVPKHAQFQLRSVALAYRHFEASGLLPEVVYRDGKCVLERFVEGLPLSADIDDASLQALARSLASLHTLPATGFGRLTHATTGWFADAATWLAENPVDVRHRTRAGDEEAPLDAEESRGIDAIAARLAAPPASLLQAPTWVCHGDLWRSNIIVGLAGGITLIDWDTIGAYPRESDLVLMVDAGFDARQKALFLQAYGAPLDAALIDWFSLRRIARGASYGLREKLQRARAHGLLA